MKGKLIHIVGGGMNQLPAVRTAKSLGLRVLVTDMFPDPPCREEADFFQQIDVTNKVGTLEAAMSFGVDAVMTDQTDVAVPTVAYVAENMGLKGIGYLSAIRFTNKHTMREIVSKSLPEHVPEFHLFETCDDAIRFIESVRNPREWVVKPINSQGSKGVSTLDPGRFGQQVTHALLESRSRGILVERRISGFEYSVEAWVQDGEVRNLAVTKKFHYPANNCIDFRNTYLGDVSPELEEVLFSLNERVIKSIGLRFGVTHAEYMVEDGKPFLIEVAARGGGGSISSVIIPFLTGFEPNKALIHCLFDEPYMPEITDYRKRFVVMKFFEFRPGVVKTLTVDAERMAGLIVFQLDLKPGDQIRDVRDSRDRVGYFVVGADSAQEALRLERAVEDSVFIEYED